MTEAAGGPSLRIVRRFAVSPDVVFDALTDPESMRIWWGRDVTFDMDLRAGGRRTIVRREGETTYTATGKYLEIERPHRLKYTYAMPQFSPNVDTAPVEIEEDETGGVVTFVQSGEDIADELRELRPGAQSPVRRDGGKASI